MDFQCFFFLNGQTTINLNDFLLMNMLFLIICYYKKCVNKYVCINFFIYSYFLKILKVGSLDQFKDFSVLVCKYQQDMKVQTDGEKSDVISILICISLLS